MFCGKSFTFPYDPRSWRWCLGLMLFCLSVLSGCATTDTNGDPKTNIESLYKEADEALAAGQAEKAISLWNQVAKENPTSPTPWLKMANTWFELNNYPSAIVAASEAQQRDASSQDAKSVLVVAGLRIAAKAVAGLRPNGTVNMNARAEAENLTNSLREILGEKVLVPPAGGETRSSASPARTRSRPHAHGATSASKSPQGTSSSGTADPFRSLK